MGLAERIARANQSPVLCPVDYPHHPHLIIRDTMRSISDAPWCEGIPAASTLVQSPFIQRALAGTLPAKVIR